MLSGHNRFKMDVAFVNILKFKCSYLVVILWDSTEIWKNAP